MNKKIRALLEVIKAKNEQAKSFLDGESKDIEKANALFDEIEILKSELEAEKKALENDKIAAGQKFDERKSEKGKETNSTEKFANDIKLLATKKLSEGVNDDGGYTVPEDIQTKINQYKTADFSFEDYIDKENVTTAKGSRIYQKKTDVTGFSKVDEGSDFAEIAEPKFEKQTFEITDKGGVLAVTNSLLRDTAENIENVIVEWFAKNRRATINNDVLTLLATKTKTAITDVVKGLKKVVNVTLGAAYADTSKIYTNDDGVDLLDNLVDTNGRPLLNPIPTEPKKLQLSVGARVIEIVNVPNSVLKTTGKKIPFVVGDLHEAIKRFDRQSLEIKGSDIASVGSLNAFSQNLTLFRGIMRDDTKLKDNDAFVYCEYTVTE
jgi:HK97 family phage major capsid protein|nr:MAG TPA: major capsid protein [Caudoviricetes sp.]